MAEAFLRHRLNDLGSDARVASAGLLFDGRSATEDAVAVMAALHVDTSRHRSAVMTVERLETADLVVGMAREHVREAVMLVPSAWPKTFTLKEFVRRAQWVGPRGSLPFDEWVAKVHTGRSRTDLLGSSHDDDVADPIGRPRHFYERTASEIKGLVDELYEFGWGRG